MHTTRQTRVLLPLLAFLVVAPLASAQSIAEPGRWTATPFLGVAFGVSDDLKSSLTLGGAIGYDWTSNFGLEGELGYVFDVAGDSAVVDWSLTNVSINALYHFDVRHITPYATFGLGFERSDIDPGDDPNILALLVPSSTEVAYNFGGGVKYRLNDRFIARADVRRFQANDLAPDYWRLYGGLTFNLNLR